MELSVHFCYSQREQNLLAILQQVKVLIQRKAIDENSWDFTVFAGSQFHLGNEQFYGNMATWNNVLDYVTSCNKVRFG